jgi:CBS domain-containing protein
MKTAESIMSMNPCCCTAEDSLSEVSKKMVEHDCGVIPVVDTMKDLRLVGVITDRDVVCRSLGLGLNPLEMKASQVMTFPVVSATQDTSIQKCGELMEKNHIRRIPVTDDYDKVVGIISLADIVNTKQDFVLDVLKEVSTPAIH